MAQETREEKIENEEIYNISISVCNNNYYSNVKKCASLQSFMLYNTPMQPCIITVFNTINSCNVERYLLLQCSTLFITAMFSTFYYWNVQHNVILLSSKACTTYVLGTINNSSLNTTQHFNVNT